MRYKFLSEKYIFSLLLLIFAAGVGKTTSYAADLTDPSDVFEPGTTCRKTEDPRLGVVCGVVRNATPQEVDVGGATTASPNPPIEGVSVYMYECDANSPTCKSDGALTNIFSSTSSDENGYYYITMRKVGNNQIRYLAFACGGKLAGLFRIPSYASFTLNTPLSCVGASSYAPPPPQLNPISFNKLSCDITRTNPEDTSLLPSYEGTFSQAYKPELEFNFFLEITAADSRYKVRGDVLGTVFDYWLNDPDVTPTKGAFYHEDCERIYGTQDAVSALCFSPGANATEPQKATARNAYENNLYTNALFTRMNFLPNIPIKSSLLFFKDITARQDVVNYSQNPTAPAQLLHTIFSNCRGSVYLRERGDATKDVLPECDELKSCNSASATIEGDYRNRQYSAGPARNLANPAILLSETEATLDDSMRGTEVCQKGGTKIKIGDIQPPWSYCKPGEAGCAFVLDKSYWNPEFSYFFGNKGTSTKVGYSFEGTNDTFYGAGVNQKTFTRNQEKGGVPVKGGTYYSDNNYALSRNNGLTPIMAGIATSELSKTAYSLSYVLQRPGETLEDKALYDQGTIKIEDAGSNLLSFCENSNVNNHNDVFLPQNEDSVDVNNDFKGNPDHYFDTIELSPKGKRTATSTIFYTTAAKFREYAYENLTNEVTKRMDIYDSLLTSSHGSGSYNPITLFLTWVGAAIGGIGSDNKSYFDRTSPYNLDPGAGDLRDDIQVGFDLSEENFEDYFKLPNASDGSLSTSDWGPWYDSCYTRNEIGAGGRCYEGFGITDIPNEITRTCRVNKCSLITVKKVTTCQVRGDSVITSTPNPSPSETACKETDLFNQSEKYSDAILRCAEEKKDCYSGGWDIDGCVFEGGSGVTQPACSQNPLSSAYWPASVISSPQLPHEGSCAADLPGTTGFYQWEYSGSPDNRSCIVTLSDQATAPGCDMQDAGPYTCAADVSKDSNFRSAQATFRPSTPDVGLDATKIINNEMWKKLSHPLTNKVYGNLAFMSADTSVSQDTTNVSENKNKDIMGFGGAAPEYKMISAHALYVNPYTGGDTLNYHCINSELGSSTGWLCPLNPVPIPEIINPNMLAQSLVSACQLSTTQECTSNFGSGIGALSPTFRLIVDAAASIYQVPAASIVTYLKVVHKPDIPLYQYLFSTAGEQALFEASFPWYGKVSQCDDTNTAAIGPYDWIKVWFDKVDISSELDALSSGRGAVASRCNFLDATFAAAKELSGLGCANLEWPQASESIKDLAFGNNRVGAYSDTELAGYWQEKGALWASCYAGAGTTQTPQ
ncbi:hypothetical protein A3K01_03235 [candidate division WWE3 bacterium RIFOXYD1_FULL_43_17]|uniref:Ig-like domain-containing protein n=2 Tax=Katanobacteria TaxID=422282 RepID=A0A1F4XEJ4_UNCKA|nr:MAG: hypothetical protein A3K01_03235 [candidate division WWE3 bacterium RIFOXYD1_FULL_43_17]